VCPSELSLVERNEIRRVRTEDEFRAVLKKDRAALFFWDVYSVYTAKSEAVVTSWVRRRQPPVEVYRVAAYEQHYVWDWLAERGNEGVARRCRGSVVWLRKGEMVAESTYPAEAGEGGLQRLTLEAFKERP
jgi:hypothetical protein